jgi:phosphoribosylformylglycinamidine cyclo-ligase
MEYRSAGVDIDAGNETIRRIKSLARGTFTPGVLSDIGSFGGLFRLDRDRYQEPVLVSSADGVGTKLKVAFMTGRHDTVGADLVNHCVNDILVQGAEPLFFLDYLATGRLLPAVAEQVVSGIARGCQENGCALLGGETAEMPGFYAAGEYDLAGFCVGVVEKSRRIDGRAIAPGDRLLGLASSGFHSNGYSLVRRVFIDELHADLGAHAEGIDVPLGEALLAPTRIYVRALRRLAAADLLRGAAHITGGGLVDNPTRMLPPGARLKLQIRLGSWPEPPLMRLIAREGRISAEEMRRTFNVGVGMVVAVPAAGAGDARRLLEDEGETVFEIGAVAAADAPNGPVEFLAGPPP